MTKKAETRPQSGAVPRSWSAGRIVSAVEWVAPEPPVGLTLVHHQQP